MRRSAFVLLLALFAAVCVPSIIAYERIDTFRVEIKVNADSTLDVIETVVYNTGGLQKRGIFRDIRLLSYDGKKLGISGISCVDSAGERHEIKKTFSGDNINIRIGSPDITFSGQKTYIIKYTISGSLGQFENYDEIYWNATGNYWPFPIEATHVTVRVPDGASIIQSAGYYGPAGAKNAMRKEEGGAFSHSERLTPGEGATVAVGFSKGFVKHKKSHANLLKIMFSLFVLFLPVFVFVKMYRHWHEHGRDPVSDRPIIPHYDVPHEMTPLEAGALVRESSGANDISAEIVHLAVKGFLNIEKTQEKILIVKVEDYVLRKIDREGHVSAADKKLLDGIFEKGNEVRMSSLTNKFYSKMPGITNAAFEALVSKGFYKKNPQKVRIKYIAIAAVVMGAAFFLPILIMWSRVLGTVQNAFALVVSCVLSAFIIGIFGYLMPVRTKKGLEAKEHLLGLREYLDIAEKDRIKFHNAPEKKPEVFEKFLPYAMVFGLEKEWAKEFEGIYTQPSGWYSDRSMRTFSAVAFAGSMKGFSDYSSRAISSSPSSSGSGSGGGGSSGGGGGGGGGGSW